MATSDGLWQPNRDPATEAARGWEDFIERCRLSMWPETERIMLRGQDGWAFGTAVRFQTHAHELAKTKPAFYWSGYHLLWLLIDRARRDLTFLEALEALATARLTDIVATRQLQQLGVWPTSRDG